MVAAVAATFLSVRGEAHVSYLTAPVERGDVIQIITATGTLQPVVTIDVGSQISGQVRDVLVDFNDEVRKDQPIARLDAMTFEAGAREAEAALEVARAAVATHEAAVAKAQADLENARYRRRVAEEQIGGARAALEEAQRGLARIERLRERGTVSQHEAERTRATLTSASAEFRAAEARQQVEEAVVQSAAAELEMAGAELRNQRAFVRQKQATLDKANIELSRTTIRAPIEGIIISRDVEPGQTVAASLEAPTLFQIAGDLREMMVYTKIDEAEIGRVGLGQRATFTVDSYPEHLFEGTVVQIRKAPEDVQNVVTYTILLLAKNPDRLLLPGMTAIVRIVSAQAEDVLKIPNAALRFRPPPKRLRASERQTGAAHDASVWLLDPDGEPRAVAIKTGLADDTATAIAGGVLQSGQRVIVGISRARDSEATHGFRLGL